MGSEIRNGRARCGFKLKCLETEREIILAHENRSLLESWSEKFKVSKYYVNVGAVECFVTDILDVNKIKNSDLIIIDEIGKMELLSQSLAEQFASVLADNGFNILSTIPLNSGHDLIRKIKQNHKVIEVTHQNRDQDWPQMLKIEFFGLGESETKKLKNRAQNIKKNIGKIKKLQDAQNSGAALNSDQIEKIGRLEELQIELKEIITQIVN